MTKQKIISYLKKDIKRLYREEEKLRKSKEKNSRDLLFYIISRKHTLKEILEMF